MKFSFIVPVYNAEKYLNECIDSVINQTTQTWELILVDDGSADFSACICDAYAQKYSNIKVTHKKNEGQLLTRMRGIEDSDGDYIAFLDADDYLEKDYIEKLTEIIEEHGYPDAVCFGFRTFDSDGKQKDYCIKEINNTLIDKTKSDLFYKAVVSGKIPGSLWSKVFKKKCIKNNGFNPNLYLDKRFAEDMIQSYFALTKSEYIYICDSILYNYRILPESMSNKIDFDNLNYFNTVFIYDFLYDLPEIKNSDELSSRLAANNFNSAVYRFLECFRAAESGKERKKTVDFDWETYLSTSTKRLLENNPYIRASYLPIWNSLKKHDMFAIVFREKKRLLKNSFRRK